MILIFNAKGEPRSKEETTYYSDGKPKLKIHSKYSSDGKLQEEATTNYGADGEAISLRLNFFSDGKLTKKETTTHLPGPDNKRIYIVTQFGPDGKTVNSLSHESYENNLLTKKIITEIERSDPSVITTSSTDEIYANGQLVSIIRRLFKQELIEGSAPRPLPLLEATYNASGVLQSKTETTHTTESDGSRKAMAITTRYIGGSPTGQRQEERIDDLLCSAKEGDLRGEVFTPRKIEEYSYDERNNPTITSSIYAADGLTLTQKRTETYANRKLQSEEIFAPPLSQDGSDSTPLIKTSSATYIYDAADKLSVKRSQKYDEAGRVEVSTIEEFSEGRCHTQTTTEYTESGNPSNYIFTKKRYSDEEIEIEKEEETYSNGQLESKYTAKYNSNGVLSEITELQGGNTLHKLFEYTGGGALLRSTTRTSSSNLFSVENYQESKVISKEKRVQKANTATSSLLELEEYTYDETRDIKLTTTRTIYGENGVPSQKTIEEFSNNQLSVRKTTDYYANGKTRREELQSFSAVENDNEILETVKRKEFNEQEHLISEDGLKYDEKGQLESETRKTYPNGDDKLKSLIETTYYSTGARQQVERTYADDNPESFTEITTSFDEAGKKTS